MTTKVGLWLTTLLLFAAARRGAVNALDMFVQDYYRRFVSGTTDDAETCDFSCGNNNCLLSSRQIFVQNHCVNEASFSAGEERGSRKYYINGTLSCQQAYFDQSCQDPEPFDYVTNCKQIDVLENCDETGTIWTILKDFCVELSSPVPPFVTPLVSRRVYPSDVDCQSETNIYGENIATNDPTLCLSGSYALRDITQPRQPGSLIGYCSGDTYVNEVYMDSICQSFEPSEMFTNGEFPTLGDCTPPSFPGLGLPTNIRYQTDCEETPRYYCKDFVEAGLGTRVGGGGMVDETNDEKTPPPSPSAPQPTEAPVATTQQASPTALIESGGFATRRGATTTTTSSWLYVSVGFLAIFATTTTLLIL